MNQPTAISLARVTKTFKTKDGNFSAVRGLDLEIQAGQIVALLGPNGAGKTTTIDMILGLTAPSTGKASVYGSDPRAAVHAGRVSAVLQTGGLLRDLTVRETIQMVASTFASHSGVEHVMERAGLMDLARRKVSKCSGGEQQRLRFALALLPDPDLLILDEPTAGMDVGARREFWKTMQVEAAAGRTIIFATHYLEEADAFAQRIVLMARGNIVADGSTEEIRAQASGRTVTATVEADALDEVVASLESMAEVNNVSTDGQRVTVASTDSDAVARRLLTDLGGRDLEITTGSLESAFVSITGDQVDSDSSTGNDSEAVA
ncbi:ABC transporter ATP-binding protein [Ornithinimicrobium sp. Arc0846-15]|nr:ABC transporter ATP-binding protein [Ornithinimicrobium laminariae]